MRIPCPFRGAAMVLLICLGNASVQSADPFEKNIRPLLAEKCQSCHSAEKAKGGLRLDSRAALLKGGDSGPAVVPGKAEESLLIRAVRHSGNLKMPPQGKLKDEEIARLAGWIASGANWPDSPGSGNVATLSPDNRESLATKIDRTIARNYRGPEIPLASDLEFQRRLYLDLLGRGPSVKETEAFLARLRGKPDNPMAIRWELIDTLLEHDEFPAYFAKVLDVMFTERREVNSLMEFRAWIRRWLAERRPINELCTEILAADGTGDNFQAAASFFRNRNAEPNLVTRDVGRIFLGRDVQCAQCHDHPLVTDYKQSEYFGILSFVNRTYLFTDAKQGNKLYLGEKAEGELEFSSVFLPKAGKTVAQPTLPMAIGLDAEPDFLDANDAYMVKPEKDQRGIPRYSRRQQLAVLATHPENELFNRNLANRLWAILMGTGLVHPVDMHHSGNPPVSAELLRLLADELVRCRYDLRAFLREIARSATYQRSVVSPDLHNWPGPKGDAAALDSEMAKLDADWRVLSTRRKQLEGEQADASKKLSSRQGDVAKWQTQIDTAKKQLQDLIGQRNTEATKLTEVRNRRIKAQETILALQSTLKELDKLTQVSPDEQLKTVRANLTARLKSANEAKQAVDKEEPAQENAVQQATSRVEDQRNRLLALASRKMALTEFVVEARGVVRRVHSQVLQIQDQLSDVEQGKSQRTILRDWLNMRDRLRSTPAGANADMVKKQKADLDRQQASLIEMWRRAYAIAPIRGLNPEQMGGAIYFALELDQPVRAKALADWNAKHKADPKQANDAVQRQQFVANVLADNMWGTLEKMVMRKFSAPAGAPQDGFQVTVDQALMLQNDPTVQSWFKPNPGTLMHRLSSIEDPGQVANAVYLSILGRLPDVEEKTVVARMLKEHPAERGMILQEIVWGLLASAEFRFSS